MKITRRQLRQVIKEELTRLDEWDDGLDLQYYEPPVEHYEELDASEHLVALGVPTIWARQIASILFDPNDDYKLTRSRSPSPDDSARMKSEIKLMSGRPGWGAEGAAGEIIDAIALMYSNPKEYFANQDQE